MNGLVQNLEPNHPLARGLVFGLRLDLGQIVDLESHGASRSRIAQTRSGVWQSEARGLRFPDASASNNPLFRLPLSGTLTEGTIAIWFTPFTTTSFETICGPDVSSSSVFVARASTTTTWRLGWKNTSSVGPTVANGETAIIASRWDSSSGLIETFKNGSPDASYTGGTGSIGLATFGVGCRGASTTGPTAGGTIIRGIWLWDRKLSNAEFRAHRDQPFGYLKMPRRRIAVFVPATTTALSGSSTATLSATGTLKVSVPLAAATSAALTTAAQLFVRRPLSGSATAALTATGTLKVSVPLAGSAAMTLTTTGTLHNGSPFNGSASAVLTATGTLRVVQPLAGVASAQLTATGSLAVTRPISAVVQGGVAATATLLVTRPLSGTATATLSATGTLFLIVVQPISGSASAALNVSGSLGFFVGELPEISVDVFPWGSVPRTGLRVAALEPSPIHVTCAVE